jgi:hypothetical protein
MEMQVLKYSKEAFTVWDVDIRGDNHVNYNKYSLLLESQMIRGAERTQCKPMETPFVVG